MKGRYGTMATTLDYVAFEATYRRERGIAIAYLDDGWQSRRVIEAVVNKARRGNSTTWLFSQTMTILHDAICTEPHADIAEYRECRGQFAKQARALSIAVRTSLREVEL